MSVLCVPIIMWTNHFAKIIIIIIPTTIAWENWSGIFIILRLPATSPSSRLRPHLKARREFPERTSTFGLSLSSVGIFWIKVLYLARYHKMTYILAKVFSRCLESKIWKIYWEGRRWDTPLDFDIVANRVLRPASYRRVWSIGRIHFGSRPKVCV